MRKQGGLHLHTGHFWLLQFIRDVLSMDTICHVVNGLKFEGEVHVSGNLTEQHFFMCLPLLVPSVCTSASPPSKAYGIHCKTCRILGKACFPSKQILEQGSSSLRAKRQASPQAAVLPSGHTLHQRSSAPLLHGQNATHCMYKSKSRFCYCSHFCLLPSPSLAGRPWKAPYEGLWPSG